MAAVVMIGQRRIAMGRRRRETKELVGLSRLCMEVGVFHVCLCLQNGSDRCGIQL